MAVGDQKQDYATIDLARAIALLGEKDNELSLLIHRLKQLEKMLYGPRSAKRNEQVDPSSLLPFPGMQALLDSACARAEERASETCASEKRAADAAKSAHNKPAKRSGPRSLNRDIPQDVPRHRREKKLEPSQCSCGCGGKLVELREEVSRRWEQIKLAYVDERVTTYYACRKCEKVISVAPDQDIILEGSSLGPGLIANLVYQRFGNHTPYNRLEQEYRQMGVPISRSVIGRNVLKCGELLRPIYERLWESILGGFLVQLDDTPVVVRNGNKKGRKTGRIWIYRSQEGEVFFDFRMDRSHKGPQRVIGDFEGFIQGDAYSGHDFLFRDNAVRIELGCWAHAIRKVRDARGSNKKLATEFDVLIALLTQVEHEARAMSPPERFRHRIKHARPVLDEIKDWLDARMTTVAPKSPMGGAIAYLRNHWIALTNYLLDGRITDITNNAAERALRRVAIGRKNWMNIGIEDAGEPAVILMSILQTCVEQDVNAIEYLRDVLVRINKPGTAAKIDDLTPAGWKRCQAAKARIAENRVLIAKAAQSLVYQQII